ncbi:hypothetical protein NI467_00240 [Acinetobacter bohemicus]|uniref:Uncharacterized protein n=1 Tax=Acinetobacter lwoffii TaxID=28090 RepID=A0A9D2UR89_ACILW|nr:DUF6587 family protein [Acinetobacter sp. S4397-1]MCO8043813.1 hypothetical protein [Acinetobacter sp. S4397-1]HJF27441.1 hypothetical protein [Acinetobacter lwoffii]
MIEILIVAVLVLWSTLVVFKKVFPNTSRSFFQKLSGACAAKGWERLAKWLQPAMASGCGNCACPVSEQTKHNKPDAQAVKWK